MLQWTLNLHRYKIRESRLDLIGRDHSNPEGDFPYAGETFPCPHIHIADSKYGIAIAYPLNENIAEMYLDDSMLDDLSYVLKEFLKRINVANVDDYEYNHYIEFEVYGNNKPSL